MSDQGNKPPPGGTGDDAGAGLVLPGDEGFEAQVALQDDEAGLEVDERQQEEIRRIFGTSFPQYLQPVEEIIGQIVSGEGDPESQDALSGMLSSLLEASERMGFSAVHQLVGRLGSTVAMLEGLEGDPADDALKNDIDAIIRDLKAMAREMSGEPPDEGSGAGQTSQTVVAALKNKPGVGKLVLKRLSAAGLVTVDQLLVARPDEIAAVAGIDIDIVHTILRYLRPETAPEGSGTPPAQPRGEVDALHQEIVDKLRREADIEAAVESLKAEIREIRSTILSRRAELEFLDLSAGEKVNAFNTFQDQMADQHRLLDEFNARHNALYRRYVSTEETVQKKEMKLQLLRKERRSLERETVDLSRTVGGLIERVQTVRRAFAKRRPME